MRPIFRISGIVVLTFIASITAVGVLVLSMRLFLGAEQSPANLLPAEETIALVIEPDATLIELLHTWFPEISENFSTEIDALAITERLDGTKGIVFFQALGPEGTGPYDVRTIPEEDRARLYTLTKPLNEHTAFRGLDRQRRKGPWLFMKTNVLPKPKTLGDYPLIGHMLMENTHMGLFADEELRIDMWNDQQSKQQGKVPSVLYTFTDDTELSVQFASPVSLWMSELQTLPDEERLAIESITRKWIENLLGKKMSPVFDLAPLLEKPASLVITSSGSTHFLLQGSGRDHTELNEKLELLHESVNAMSPTSRITHRTLDNRFTARDIRVNDNNYERTFYENSWKIHNVNYSEKKLEFLTAKRGTDYMISNSETLLMKAVREEKHAVALPIPESISSKRILGGGMIKKETLQKLKDLLFIDASVLPFPTEDGAIWSTTEHGKITTLIIQNML